MTDLLTIGASGVHAYQSALTTVSENIANVGTAGYTRRGVVLSEVGVTGVSASGKLTAGQGVATTSIVRSADQFRAADVRNASADLARSETGIAWLDRIQTSLTGNQLGDRLTGFFNAATAISADPTASTPRSAFLESATSVANAFTATGKSLDSLTADLDATGDNAAQQLTNIGAALAKINDGLARAQPGSGSAAQLADQRDSLLEQASALSDVSVTTDAAGRATVKLGNADGPVLVSGISAASVTYARGNDGTVSFALHDEHGITAVGASGGAVAGIVDGALKLADARQQLNTVAGSFRDAVNAFQANGQDLNGHTGQPLFASGATASDLTLTLTDPSGIAAAAIGGGTRDNSNLATLAASRTSGAFESRTTALVSTNAATLASRQQVADAQSAIRDSAITARDSVSGVNLDTEAVDLLRFQQAYSASSRVIQVARDTLQSILDIR